jgi:hypothetical protein
VTSDSRIDRAHAALGGPALTTNAELRALTPDQLEKCVHRALEAHDVEAVEGYLLLMALKDPHRAADIVETLKIGVRLAKETRPAPNAGPAVADSTDRLAVGVAATRIVRDHHPDGVNPDDYETCECGWTASDENERWADHLVHVLAVDGLLAEFRQGDWPASASRDDEILGVCSDALERGWTVEQLAERIRAVYDPTLAAELERRARAAEAAGFDEPAATPLAPPDRYRGEADYLLEGDDEIFTEATGD